jgi:diguanylate cyclase (GGDEF)-like protein
MEEELARAAKKGTRLALILFDIDRFKLINYGYGDLHGDLVLQEVAELAEKKLPPNYLGRWSGQQFLCVLPQTNGEDAATMAEDLRERIQRLMLPIDGHSLRISASFGVACFPQDGDLVRTLLAAAEAALYQAKDSGRNRVVVAQALKQQIFGMGAILDAALRENRVVPAYQPIVDLKTGAIVAEEALARLVTTDGSVLEAEDFIEVARQLQLTYKVDHAIISSTISRCLASLDDGPPRLHFVNISGNLLRNPDVVQDLLRSVREHCQACTDRLGAQKPLVIEITEREFLGDIKKAREMLMPFLDFGLRLALDDFGAGYSSFQYLADLPFSFLKIEGSLIKRVREPKVKAILQGIQNTAADLGLTTLAECVESAEIADAVHAIGIDWGQGYHYDRPSVPGFSPPAQKRRVVGEK